MEWGLEFLSLLEGSGYHARVSPLSPLSPAAERHASSPGTAGDLLALVAGRSSLRRRFPTLRWLFFPSLTFLLGAGPIPPSPPGPTPPRPPVTAPTGGGILGISVEETGFGLLVNKVLPGSPAEKAGIGPGDLLVKAGDVDLAPLTVAEGTARLRGEVGSSVTVEVEPALGGPLRKLTLAREQRTVVESKEGAGTVKEPDAYARYVAQVRGPDSSQVVPALEALISSGMGGIEPRIVMKFTGQTLVHRPDPAARAALEQVRDRLVGLHPEDGLLELEAVEQLLLATGRVSEAMAAARSLAEKAEKGGPLRTAVAQGAWELTARAAKEAGDADVERKAVARRGELIRPGLLLRNESREAQAPQWVEVSAAPDKVAPAVEALRALGESKRAEALAERFLALTDDEENRKAWKSLGLSLPTAVSTEAWRVESAKAPSFQVSTFEGGTFDLEAERGHPVLLVFWASWCGPCKKEMPHLEALYRELAPRGLKMLALAVQDEPARSRATLVEGGYTFPAATCSSTIQQDFAVGPIPATRLIDASGTVRLSRKGYSEENVNELGRISRALLEEADGQAGAPLARIREGGASLKLRRFIPEADAGSLTIHRRKGGPDQVWLGGPGSLPRLLLPEGKSSESPILPRPSSAMMAAGDGSGNGSSQVLAARRGAMWARFLDAQGEVKGWFHGPHPLTALASADLDGDGKHEWILAGSASEGRTDLRILNGGGALQKSHPLEAEVAAMSTVSQAPGGESWVLMATSKGLYRLDGRGISPLAGPSLPGAKRVSTLPDGSWTAVGAPGVADVAAGRTENGLSFAAALRSDGAVLLFDSSGQLHQRVQLRVAASSCATADVDGDGSDELILALPGTGFAVLEISMPTTK